MMCRLLHTITNLVYLTKMDSANPEQVIAHMTVIEEQLRILGEVTSQALTYHRTSVEAKEFDLIHIAEAALKLHADKFSRRNIAVDRRFRGPASANMQGGEILQVLSNLILNAVEAIDGGKGRLSVRVSSRAKSIHLLISDNGPGVPKGVVSRLFAPYATSKKGGTGLGLWLSRRIVEKHGGNLKFRTSNNGPCPGTTFRLSIPKTK